eukprot:jgi/Mesvir1/15168/Mv26218-RA.1
MWQQWAARWLLISLTFPPPATPPPPSSPPPSSMNCRLDPPVHRRHQSKPSSSTSTNASMTTPSPLSACKTPQASPPWRPVREGHRHPAGICWPGQRCSSHVPRRLGGHAEGSARRSHQRGRRDN